MKNVLTGLVFLGVVAWLVVPAVADDIRIPEWRGEWSTTYQYWDFLTPNAGDPSDPLGGVKPDGPGPLVEGQPGQPYEQEGYLPSTMLWVTPGPGMQWLPDDPTGTNRRGIWPLSGSMEVVVDNHKPVNPYKLVWLQLTWHAQEIPCNWSIGNFNPAPLPEDLRLVDHIDHADGWTTTIYEWYLRPNPPDERFTISGNIYVDQLVIDTWCVPEPSTLAMLLGVSLMALGWRRKK